MDVDVDGKRMWEDPATPRGGRTPVKSSRRRSSKLNRDVLREMQLVSAALERIPRFLGEGDHTGPRHDKEAGLVASSDQHSVKKFDADAAAASLTPRPRFADDHDGKDLPPKTHGIYVSREKAAQLQVQREAEISTRIRSTSENTVMRKIIDEREEDVRQVHREIHGLNEISRDLASQVQLQQESVDNLEAQAQRTKATVQKAKAKIDEAKDIQTKTPQTCSLS